MLLQQQQQQPLLLLLLLLPNCPTLPLPSRFQQSVRDALLSFKVHIGRDTFLPRVRGIASTFSKRRKRKRRNTRRKKKRRQRRRKKEQEDEKKNQSSYRQGHLPAPSRYTASRISFKVPMHSDTLPPTLHFQRQPPRTAGRVSPSGCPRCCGGWCHCVAP